MKHLRNNPSSPRVLLALTALVLALTAGRASAQGRTRIAGTTYVQQQGKWFMEDRGRQYEVDPRVITIKLSPEVTPTGLTSLMAQRGFKELRTNALGYVDVEIPAGDNPLDYVREMQDDLTIESAEVNTIGEYFQMDPDDPTFPSQWHLVRINAAPDPTDSAWDITKGDESVVVAVLDSGTDVGHEDLRANIWINPDEDLDNDMAIVPANPDHLDGDDLNGADDGGNGFVDDLVGWDFHNGDNNVRGPFYHGTHVAGIVAASINNGTGVAGVAGGWAATPGVSIMAVGVGDNSPNGAILDDAIIYAADNGADIITLSLGVAASAAIDAALTYAYNTRGVFINNAAGNGSGPVGYPATHVDVVAVSATGQADAVSGFSDTGPEIELSAPGETIWSTRLNDTYGEGDGTSYASPQVAGVAALLLSCDSSLTNDQVRATLQNSSEDLGPAGRDNGYGFGLLDALEALNEAGCMPPATTAPQIRQVSLLAGAFLTDSSLPINSGADLAFNHRRDFAPQWSWELELGAVFTDDGVVDGVLAHGQMHLVRRFGAPPVEPFTLIGLGAVHYNSVGFSDSALQALLGIGADFTWTPRVGFRLDLRVVGIDDLIVPGWSTDYQLLWGPTFSF
jgi:subtilisin family serine protease